MLSEKLIKKIGTIAKEFEKRGYRRGFNRIS